MPASSLPPPSSAATVDNFDKEFITERCYNTSSTRWKLFRPINGDTTGANRKRTPLFYLFIFFFMNAGARDPLQHLQIFTIQGISMSILETINVITIGCAQWRILRGEKRGIWGLCPPPHSERYKSLPKEGYRYLYYTSNVQLSKTINIIFSSSRNKTLTPTTDVTKIRLWLRAMMK